ncbi:hypothetical protein [Aquimarina algiphila]|uniref:Uncharacterized protein n=1 Tax=Aquimarina algiphila TaxID=2047982 RepID=A0A554VAU7_9FLAO|nr:hypothetical protein [Aquimarina algiphila]TSE03388.1 hypothetical protein FOF46_29415 [Aquimarina algiphila]
MIDINQIQNETERFVNQNPKILNSAILGKEITLNKYARLVPKIRGQYATVNGLMGNVVQAFSSKWTPMGDVQLRGKLSKDYHQKVNFIIKPAEVLGSWIEQKYDEGKELKDKSISQHIMKTMLSEKIISDVEFLSMSGINDPAQALADPPVFGFSMDGLNTTLARNASNTENPYYKIPIDVITDINVRDVLKEWEKGIPKDYVNLMDAIYVSHRTYMRLKEHHIENHSQNTGFKKDDFMYSPLLGKKIVKLNGLSDNVFVAWVNRNLMRLTDVIQNPATITDIQKFHYELHVMGEFTLGYDFAINELVIVGSSNGTLFTERGLGDAELNKLYYPQEYTKITSPGIPNL